MNLWVRSQSKTKLLKVDNLELITNQFGHCIFAFSGNKEYCIGKYSSFERALEILSDIEEMIVINSGYILATNSGIKPDNINSVNYCAVYEMPTE